MDAARLRAQFPVLDQLAYLNAGTDGPVPRAAVAAATEELERQADLGRWAEHRDRRIALQRAQRSAYAALLTCRPSDVALTTSTSEGVATVLAGLQLGRGEEIVTSDEEHPGLLGPLQAARDRYGVSIRVAPFSQLAEAVTAHTRLIACSHVSWVSGRFCPAALRDLNVPLLLDGAQALGAVAVDVEELHCDFYAAAGQKWLCGPDGTGMLYVAPERLGAIAVDRRSYVSYEDAAAGLDAQLHPDARRFDAPALAAEASAFAVTAVAVLADAGWDEVYDRGRTLAARLADELRARGREVAPRDPTTLVSWHSDDPATERARMAARGVVVRDLPGRDLLRASVGAWNDESDLERLLEALD